MFGRFNRDSVAAARIVGAAAARCACALWVPAVLACAAGTAHAGQWTCSRAGSQPVLKFSGGIEGGEYGRFLRAYADCFPGAVAGPQTIDLHSGGGAVNEALQIAEYLVSRFRDRPPLLATQVSPGSVCISACTYLFVAGQQRDVAAGGTLEPHGFSRFLGPPMRVAIRNAQQKAERDRVDLLDALMSDPAWIFRGNVIAQGLGRALAADPRLTWIAEYYGAEADSRRDVARRFKSFMEMPPERQALIRQFDAVALSTLPELERLSALQAFNAQFAMARGSDKPAVPSKLDRPEALLRWAIDGYLEAVNAFIDATRAGPRLRDLDASGLRQVHEERSGSAFNLANGKLGSFLAARANDIDVPAFVRLMFSVSILYTRPLTREEMCDANLVNRGCD
jgi:hypothetical protein